MWLCSYLIVFCPFENAIILVHTQTSLVWIFYQKSTWSLEYSNLPERKSLTVLYSTLKTSRTGHDQSCDHPRVIVTRCPFDFRAKTDAPPHTHTLTAVWSHLPWTLSTVNYKAHCLLSVCAHLPLRSQWEGVVYFSDAVPVRRQYWNHAVGLQKTFMV